MAVVVLLADGVRPDTLAGAIDAGALPALARLRDEGGLHAVTHGAFRRSPGRPMRRS